MTSEERVQYVCRRLGTCVGQVAPEGVGRWDRAWELVADPSSAFLEALDAWKREDTLETRGRLQAAADEVVQTWWKAGQEWLDSGSPQTCLNERPEVAEKQSPSNSIS